MGKSFRELYGANPEGAKKGWKLFVDRKEIPADEMELVSGFGTVRYGRTPQNYDAWLFAENGGGGSVLVPFFKDKQNRLFVAVVEQPRPLQADDKVANLPRGFLDPGIDHFENAAKEAGEEFGLKDKSRVFLLEGEPGNPNNTFFFNNGVTDKGEKMGIRFYGVKFNWNEVEVVDGKVVFKQGVVKPITKDAEKIMGAKFLYWKTAMHLGCMITNAGIGRLLATLD
ncbi:MAG: hypothetical protein WCT18_00125 [Patescibacteria group bacterium]